MGNDNKNLNIDNNRVLHNSYDSKIEALRVLFVNENALQINQTNVSNEPQIVEKTILVDKPIYIDKPYVVEKIEYREIEKPIFIEKLVYKENEVAAQFNDQHLRTEIEILEEKFQRQDVRILELIDEVTLLKKENKRTLKILSLISILSTIVILLFKHI